MSDRDNRISAMILAGGRAQRMGGVDKGLVKLRDKALIAHVLDRLPATLTTLCINANRSHSEYQAFGHRLISDELADYQGPLAGIASGLAACTTPWLLVVPCDTPYLPRDLVGRLLKAALEQQANIAVAHDGQRLQPVVALIKRDLADSLDRYLAGGDRKIDIWYKQQSMTQVDFSDQPDAFLNINSLQDMSELERSSDA